LNVPQEIDMEIPVKYDLKLDMVEIILYSS
jgi:hypothetical protein